MIGGSALEELDQRSEPAKGAMPKRKAVDDGSRISWPSTALLDMRGGCAQRSHHRVLGRGEAPAVMSGSNCQPPSESTARDSQSVALPKHIATLTFEPMDRVDYDRGPVQLDLTIQSLQPVPSLPRLKGVPAVGLIGLVAHRA